MLPHFVRAIWFRSLLVFSLACTAFAPSAWNGYALDDLPNVVENRALLQPLQELWFSPAPPGTLFRPLTLFTYGTTRQLWELNPLPYHLTNILLHAAVAVLAFCLLRRMKFEALAFPVAALFAVHPLHTEVVANVSGRAELLAAFFGLSALLFILGPAGQFRVQFLRSVAGTALFLAALLSKESGLVILPVAFLCLWHLKVPRPKYVVLLPFLLVAGAFLYWRASVLGWWGSGSNVVLPLDNPLVDLDSVSRIPTALGLLGKYLSMLLLPYPLSADYSMNMITVAGFWSEVEHWLSLTLCLALLVAMLLSARVRSELFFCSAWFFLAFAVTSNVLFPIGTIFGERLAYLPSVGGLALLLLFGQRFIGGRPRAVLGSLLFLAFFWTSTRHSIVWASNETLHSYQVRVSCRSAKTLHNYAVLLRNKGALDDATVLFHAALREYPEFADAAQGLGSVYAMKGLPSGAMHWYNRALEIDPLHSATREGRARLFLALGQHENARREFERLQQLDPHSLAARLGLLAILVAEKRWDEAKTLREELLAEGHQNSELKLLGRILEGDPT